MEDNILGGKNLGAFIFVSLLNIFWRSTRLFKQISLLN